MNIRFCFLSLVMISVLIGSHDGLAQQDPQFSMFMQNRLLYNPAVSGLDEALDIRGIYRSQWAGLNGNPESQVLSASMPVYVLNTGTSIVFLNDRVGAQRNTAVYAGGAYSYSLNKIKVSAGLRVGIIQHSLDGNKLRAPDGVYEPGGTVNHNDNLLPVTNVSTIMPDIGIGLNIRAGGLEAGIALNHILEPSGQIDIGNNSLEVIYSRHLYMDAMYSVRLNDALSIKPGLLIKTDWKEIQADFNILAFYGSNIWGGMTFRGLGKNSADAIAFMGGYTFTNRIGIGYSYDIGISPLNQVHNGSHELLMTYKIPVKKPRKGKIIENSRFLYY